MCVKKLQFGKKSIFNRNLLLSKKSVNKITYIKNQRHTWHWTIISTEDSKFKEQLSIDVKLKLTHNGESLYYQIGDSESVPRRVVEEVVSASTVVDEDHEGNGETSGQFHQHCTHSFYGRRSQMRQKTVKSAEFSALSGPIFSTSSFP